MPLTGMPEREIHPIIISHVKQPIPCSERRWSAQPSTDKTTQFAARLGQLPMAAELLQTAKAIDAE